MLNDENLIWEKCLAIIKDNVNAQTYATWFSPIKPIAMEENVLTIQVPSEFFFEWLEAHYVSLIGKVLRDVTGTTCKLRYNIPDATTANAAPTFNISAQPQAVRMGSGFGYTPQAPMNPHAIPGLRKMNNDSTLNTRYTFDNYVGGDCNQLARSAGEAIADRPGGNSFNPMMLYGGVGLGKTHLIQAIGNAIEAKYPEKQVVYLAAERFSNQFVDSVRSNAQNDFINFYQAVDVLIIDDIQFLSGKDKTQSIFFHIFNQLHQQGKQIIITSDSPAKDLKGMEERLLSRFKWGLTADIKAPDLETRLAILRNRIANDGMQLSEEVVNYIAYNITNSVRDLEGALVTLVAQFYSDRKPIDLITARRVLQDLVRVEVTELSVQAIKKMVSNTSGISIEAMEGTSRKREIVQSRQIAMYLSKKHTQHSLKTIGTFFNNKDHSTVIHSCNTVDDLMTSERKFKALVEEYEKKLKSGIY